uniref:Uncharacterized protein n=1 Tax=Picea glauca TaxID=3330 RepID=A0A101M616_PICGL|nr:hypothetical protein ABT39_MTgene898 [Picea glauca]KUM51450.1 hypothetical protein ABT39_MTgene1298 [Picea glauca]
MRRDRDLRSRVQTESFVYLFLPSSIYVCDSEMINASSMQTPTSMFA